MIQNNEGDYIVLPSDLPKGQRRVAKRLYQERLANVYEPFPNPGKPAEQAVGALKEKVGKVFASLRRAVRRFSSPR